jgi:hypothetical protein
VSTHRGAYEIVLHESNSVSIDNQVLGSLLFIVDKFEDLNIQEPGLQKVIGSRTNLLPLAPVRVSLVSEAQLRHGPSELGKVDLGPVGDKTDHTLALLAATTYPVHQSSSESDSEDGREVYMVGHGEELTGKTVEAIHRNSSNVS